MSRYWRKDAMRPPGAAPESGRTDSDSLDPNDWPAFRELSHEVLDAALDHLEAVGTGPVWRPVPEPVKAALDEPLPAEPQGPARVAEDVARLVLPYATGNGHPRFFGWVHGSGTPGGMLAEMVAGALNANAGGRDHGAVYVERQVIAWCRRLFGLPEGAGGLLVSGTSMATLIGLTVARNHLADGDVRADGFDPVGSPLMGYASAEAHNSVAKAFEMLGLGRARLRAVPVDGRYRMDCEQLSRMVARDREAGSRPFCVIGTAGTVNTGALDDLAALAEICRRERMWFHVDGAFGAALMLSETLRHELRGIEQADSLAFDFHKWLHVPYDAGCILVRDGDLHRETFSDRRDYLAAADRGLAGGNPWFCEYGPELSRGFRALKVWFTLKEHGTRRLGAKIDDNCRQARYLAERVEADPGLELLAPVTLNITCFRYRRPELSAEALDRINREIVSTLQCQGIAAPSTTRLDGKLAIRVNLTNHRTREADLDLLVDAVLDIGRDLTEAAEAAEAKPSGAAVPNFQLTETAVVDKRLRGRDRAMIETACRRPELRLSPVAVTITVDPALRLPFKIERKTRRKALAKKGQTKTRGKARGGDRIVLGKMALADPSLLALYIRHALELTLLRRLVRGAPNGNQAIAVALLACRTAALYLKLMIERERDVCATRLPAWLGKAYALAQSRTPFAGPPRDLACRIAPLLELQGDDAPIRDIEQWITPVPAVANRLFQNIVDLAAPAEHLLTSGGDARLTLDPETGLNAYGCSPRPRPWAITFASSTATSISDLAYCEVERMRQDLISAAATDDRETVLRNKMEEVKRSLLGFCGAGDLAGAEIIVSTSGTDAELFTLYFALADPAASLVNIVIALDETGSGVADAARGRHFAATTAFGATVEPGKPLAHFAQGRVRLETVVARCPDGDPRPIADIDRDVERLVEVAIGKGARPLVHLLDCAKTGWRAPSFELLRRLAASADIVVDACQMRIEPKSLRAYLDAGFMVQVTGSKFYTGPPFSGALVLPPAIVARTERLGSLPASLHDYTGRLEWPEDWDPICQGLPDRTNLGLLARWTAALWEMRAFQAVPRDEQVRILAAFGEAARDAIAASDVVELCVVPNIRRPGSRAGGWDSLTTIFPFVVIGRTDAGERVALDYDQARQVYRWLNRDIADLLPAEATKRARRIAAQRCHIGQPVKIYRRGSGCVGALRLCAGARVVSGVTFDPALGASPGDRLRREIADARLVLDKVGLIVEHWRALNSAGETALGGGPIYQV